MSPEIVKTAAGLQLELSVVPLYEHRLLFNLVLVDLQEPRFRDVGLQFRLR
jgi:hypothetical protein